MSNTLNPKTDLSQPLVYQIKIEGHLGDQWTDWFEGLTITLEDNGNTLLTGPLVDQAALHGLLKKVRDLGMPLLSINRVKPGQADISDLSILDTTNTEKKTMAINEKMNSIKKTARLAGLLILIMAVFAPFSMIYVPTTLVVAGDAATTANNIMASEGLFRLGIASDSIVFLIEIAITVLLYVLLKPVNKTLSLVAAFSRLAMTIIQGINLLNHFFVLLLLSGAGYLTVFAPDQLHALVLLFLDAHESVVLIWGLFFSLHLFMLGYLVYKSGYIPRTVGILLMIASLCYLLQSFGNILFPQYKEIFTSIGLLSTVEIAFPLWLLIKGINVEQWQKRTLESA